MSLSKRVDNKIKELGWSYKIASERTEVKYQEILRIVKGERKDPRMTTLRKLSKGLGCTMDELAGACEEGGHG